MSVQNVTSQNQVNFKTTEETKNVTQPIRKEPETIEDGDKKLKYALIGLAAVGTAIAAGVAIYKHKSTPDAAIKAVKETTGGDGGQKVKKLLSDIDFNAGEARLKDGKKFTGIIEDKLKNGDKITMEYVDGILQNSTRQGKKNIEKAYEVIDGRLQTTIKLDGKTKIVNIDDMRTSASLSERRFKNLIYQKDNLSLEEFQAKANEIQFKSKNQQNEIQTKS